ncbi:MULTISPECIES: hypothetical protein [Leuconostoc]|uniref:hypothetical protein n=1 Tax=Leuconostoc TaxID=1243 RepID=UPI0002465CF3|nr:MULTISPECIES: hypothetical protein [Leuconostoc]QOG10790.1 hypothetical protein FAZ25_08045 [Leuconostoc sp. LN180020]CCF24745.1 Putative uncharacterized protein [Leuconostoc citreum LBAE C10]
MSKLTTKTLSNTTNANVLVILKSNGQYIYPGLAQEIFDDAIFGPRILKRLQRLFVDHPDGLSESGHDWYFGYLVCAYTQTHFGIKNLLNYPSVTKELFSLCLAQLSN